MDLAHATWTAVVLPWLTTFLVGLIPIAGTLGARWISAELAARNLNTAWFEAIERAAGAAYSSLLASGQPLSTASLAAASKVGAGYLAERVPGILATKGLDPKAAAQIVGAQMGKLLAVDPTVPVGGGSTATAVAGPGETATATAGLPGGVHAIGDGPSRLVEDRG